MDSNASSSFVLLSDLRFQISLLRLMYPTSVAPAEAAIRVAELERLQAPLSILPPVKTVS